METQGRFFGMWKVCLKNKKISNNLTLYLKELEKEQSPKLVEGKK